MKIGEKDVEASLKPVLKQLFTLYGLAQIEKNLGNLLILGLVKPSQVAEIKSTAVKTCQVGSNCCGKQKVSIETHLIHDQLCSLRNTAFVLLKYPRCQAFHRIGIENEI